MARHIPGLGDLRPDPDVPEWSVSQPVRVSLFAGAALRFVVTVDDDSPDLFAAIEQFLGLADRDRLAASDRVCENYRTFLDVADIEPLDVATPSEIWRFVTPTEVRVDRRSRRDEAIYVTVACECEWEPEHGLQLVFRRGSVLSRVSEQDGHLTHADAYALPDDQDPGLR